MTASRWSWNRTVRAVALTACLAALAFSPLGSITASPANAATVSVVRAVPFRGTFTVSATWGTATGPNHATPAIDFKMPIGTAIFATAAGNVDFVSIDNRNCNPLTHIPPGGTYDDAVQWCINQGMTGTRIRIRHDDGTFSMYVHLSRVRSNIKAQPSTRVTAGQLLGWSGDSGIATGPHLHYSKINAAGTATVDPVLLRACWGPTRHNYTRLNSLIGKTVRNNNYTCTG
ncbi:MAG: M23 family metallopeptidase [Acidimicrobiia bacterium]|nr:M23 family metallopeptidase [Acidimicrobiia bacterium]